MPACASENVSRFWSSSPPTSRSSSVSPPMLSSPLSTSPIHMSPISMLKRSTSDLSSSSDRSGISQVSNSSNAPTVIFTPKRHARRSLTPDLQDAWPRHEPIRRRGASLPSRLMSWYFAIVIGFFRAIHSAITYAILAPALWISAWVCLFWMILQMPLGLLKWIITVLHTPASERSRSKRCILISGGSTIQAVHLAQNFHKAGARVVVCELEGLFGLARFSTACARYYTVPRPGPATTADYVKALQEIVMKERAAYYIPVSATSSAYYDALAKPILEIMGCECFVPGSAEVTTLDDPLELLRKCRTLGLPTPRHYVLRSIDDVNRLYESGTLRADGRRHVMLPAGPAGMRDRTKVTLPPTIREFRNQQHEISERKPWVVIRDPGGRHFITCTTVKESKIVANVTCRVDESSGLIPEERPEVNRWLERFFGRTFGSRINGHLSFRLVFSEQEGNDLVSIGCRVGIGLPYICHTSIHARLVWRPCRHFSRQNSAVISGEGLERNSQEQDLSSGLKRGSAHCTADISTHLMGQVLDKREALFVYWDPLPYCAYCYLQLPFGRVAGVLRARPAQHKPPLAVVQ